MEPRSQTNALVRESGLSYDDFKRRYLNPGQPVILTDAIKDWPALTKWTPEFFANQYGDRTVEIGGRSYALREVVAGVLDPSHSKTPYMRNKDIDRLIPEATADIEPHPIYCSPNWLDGPFSWGLHRDFRKGSWQLYIGGPGMGFPHLHYDLGRTHAFLMQIYGRKRFMMYAPADTPYLYPWENIPNLSLIEDLDRPDLERFQLFPKAVRYECELGPGDTIFVPGGWWHTTKIEMPCITVSFNIANASNWSAFIREQCRALSPRAKLKRAGYLHLLRLVRRTLETSQRLVPGRHDAKV
jgi:hypothetical protein